MESFLLVVEAHRLLGYVTVFALVPLALMAYSRGTVHRALGQAYVLVMTVLYGTGLLFTVMLHASDPHVLWRNLTFNFLGYFFVLLAWRAIWSMKRGVTATRLDAAMTATIAAPAVVLAGIGIAGHFPSFLLGTLCLWLAWLDRRELAPPGPRPVILLRRHVRYMWASYFYMLTVLTLVHMRGVMPGDLRWLWPALLGVPLIAWMLEGGGAPDRGRVVVATRLTLVIVLVMGVYVVHDLNGA